MTSRIFLEGYAFGHSVYLIAEDGGRTAEDWRYSDTDELLEGAQPRKCPKCNLLPTDKDHDPCIADLPGVEYACCGHGVQEGYVKFTDGRVMRGTFTKTDKE